jgi:hypothetical protein
MNNDISKSNSLTDIAARIRHEHEAVRFALRHAVERAMNTGDLLLEAKEQLQHGQWSQWIQEHCKISDRTARLYMRLAKNRAVIEATGDVANLTLNAATRLLAPPKDDVEILLASPKADAEKDDEVLSEGAAKIRILWEEAKIYDAELRKRLAEAKTETQELFKAFLEKNKEISKITWELILIIEERLAEGITELGLKRFLEKRKEFRELLDELNLEVARIIPDDNGT